MWGLRVKTRGPRRFFVSHPEFHLRFLESLAHSKCGHSAACLGEITMIGLQLKAHDLLALAMGSLIILTVVLLFPK